MACAHRGENLVSRKRPCRFGFHGVVNRCNVFAQPSLDRLVALMRDEARLLRIRHEITYSTNCPVGKSHHRLCKNPLSMRPTRVIPDEREARRSGTYRLRRRTPVFPRIEVGPGSTGMRPLAGLTTRSQFSNRLQEADARGAGLTA